MVYILYLALAVVFGGQFIIGTWLLGYVALGKLRNWHGTLTAVAETS